MSKVIKFSALTRAALVILCVLWLLPLLGCEDALNEQRQSVVSAPEFSPPPGSDVISRHVTISCATSGATIHEIVVPKE
jgi:hypothetical protein